MDNITVEKKWSDNEFYQIRMSIESQSINCITASYVVNEEILELASNIQAYINNPQMDMKWEIGEINSSYSPKIIIHAFPCNKFGKLYVELYCCIPVEEIVGKYGCNILLETELGLFEQFGKKIERLNTADVGTIINLVE